MSRELREESTKTHGVMPEDGFCRVRILGFFRWLGRGGKPEFVGVARLTVAAHELTPNRAEVRRYDEKDCPTILPAHTLGDLSNSVRLLLDRYQLHLSIPLVAALRALDAAATAHPAELSEFLYA